MDEPQIDYRISLPLLEIDLQLESLKTQVQESKRPQMFGIGKGGTIASTTLFYEDKILIGACDGFLYCIDLNGKERWRFEAGDVVCTGVIIGDKYYFGDYDSYFYCVDMNGNLVWKLKTDGGSLGAWPVAYNDSIYIGSKYGGLYSISLDGKAKWKFYTPESVGSNIVADETGVYFGCYNNKFYCVSHEGKLVWAINTKSPTASPTIYKDKICFADFDGYFYLASKKGEILWKFNIESPIGGQSPGIPVVDGVAYFGNWNGDIFALDVENRKLLWRFKTGDMVFAKPVIVGGIAYVGSTDSNFYALDAKSGELKWKYNTSQPNVVTAGFYKGRLFFGTWHGKLICLTKDGKFEWGFQTSMKTPSSVYIEKKLELRRIIKESEIVPEKFNVGYSSANKNQTSDFGQPYGPLSSSYVDRSGDYAGRSINIGMGKIKRRYR